MSDDLTIDMDTTALTAALLKLGDVAQRYVNEASRETAAAMVREMRARLHRQLGPNATGQTEAGITSRPAYDGNGYVVLSERAHVQISFHTMSRSGHSHTQAVTQSNIPLWIEKGTKKGQPGSHTSAARPYFYSSALLEVGAHEERLREALRAALDSQGLGD